MVRPFMVAVGCLRDIGPVRAQPDPNRGSNIDLVSFATVGATEAELVAEFFGELGFMVRLSHANALFELDMLLAGVVHQVAEHVR